MGKTGWGHLYQRGAILESLGKAITQRKGVRSKKKKTNQGIRRETNEKWEVGLSSEM